MLRPILGRGTRDFGVHEIGRAVADHFAQGAIYEQFIDSSELPHIARRYSAVPRDLHVAPTDASHLLNVVEVLGAVAIASSDRPVFPGRACARDAKRCDGAMR